MRERFAGERAERYDEGIRLAVPAYEEMHGMARHLLRSFLGESARVLVSGSGTGAEIVNLGRHNPGWRLTGVDPSPDMGGIASERIARHGLADRVEFHTGLVRDLPPPTPLYDAATAILVMHFLPDDGRKLGFLRDIFERLKPGAPLILADLYGDKGSTRFAYFTDAWRLRQLETAMPEDAIEAMLDDVASNIELVPRERMLALLHEAGFEGAELFYNALLFGGWIARKAPGAP
jgi:tRNA (cmo5U34)-methyltransferase